MPDQRVSAVAYDVGDPHLTGFCRDLMRGLKDGAPFWVMEQQTGQAIEREVSIAPRDVRVLKACAFIHD